MKDIIIEQGFIHYGHRHFDKQNNFKPIKNKYIFTKPEGGLWGSPINSPLSWKRFFIKEDMKSIWGSDYITKWFTFRLKDNAKVLFITSTEELKDLPHMPREHDLSIFDMWEILDFEKLTEQYDCMIVLLSEDDRLYSTLTPWDVDSILIFNPDIVEEVDSSDKS